MESLESTSSGGLPGFPLTVSLANIGDAWTHRCNPQKPGEQYLKKGRDSIQVAVDKKERAVVEQGWQGGLPELNGADLE